MNFRVLDINVDADYRTDVKFSLGESLLAQKIPTKGYALK
ncbi:hypothetical protein RAHE111665_04360 [Rariglobus hedericola]